MKDLSFEETRLVKLIKGIKHQNIGGKEFRIEKEGTIGFIKDYQFKSINIAMMNLIGRRPLWNLPDDTKVYYGHVLKTNLGYFIVEDEIEKGE